MFHFVSMTNQELSDFPGFFLVKEDGSPEISDYFVVTNTDEVRKQVFFTVADVKSHKTTKGIKRGYCMVKVKRSKNPILKAVEVANDELNESKEGSTV